MKTVSIMYLVSAVALAAGCASEDKPHAAASLGVTKVITSETATDLVVTGLDASGREIAAVTIHYGDVVLPDDDRTVRGHELLVNLHGEMSLRYANEGVLRDTVLPFLEPEGGEREQFLRDARVVAALARWSVAFADRDAGLASDETAYDACTNSRCTGTGNYELQCCQSGNWQYVTCATAGWGTLNNRGCGNAPTCSGGGSYNSTTGCPSGQTAICGNGNFQNPSNTRVCHASACTDKMVGVNGCAVCSQTAAGSGNWWSVVDNGTCTNTAYPRGTIKLDGYSPQSLACELTPAYMYFDMAIGSGCNGACGFGTACSDPDLDHIITIDAGTNVTWDAPSNACGSSNPSNPAFPSSTYLCYVGPGYGDTDGAVIVATYPDGSTRTFDISYY